jgi:hypothetical protein
MARSTAICFEEPEDPKVREWEALRRDPEGRDAYVAQEPGARENNRRAFSPNRGPAAYAGKCEGLIARDKECIDVFGRERKVDSDRAGIALYALDIDGCMIDVIQRVPTLTVVSQNSRHLSGLLTLGARNARFMQISGVAVVRRCHTRMVVDRKPVCCNADSGESHTKNTISVLLSQRTINKLKKKIASKNMTSQRASCSSK